jgi:hypothetical protein
VTDLLLSKLHLFYTRLVTNLVGSKNEYGNQNTPITAKLC